MAGLDLQHPTGKRLAEVDRRKRLALAVEPACKVGARRLIDEPEALTIVTVFDLIVGNLLHRRPGRQKGLGQIGQLHQAAVVDVRAALGVEAENALLHAVQRQFEGFGLACQLLGGLLQALLAAQQGVGARGFGAAQGHGLAHVAVGAQTGQREKRDEQQPHHCHRALSVLTERQQACAQRTQGEDSKAQCRDQVKGGERQ